MLNQIIFLCLIRDDFVERPILVKQQVRVSITKHSCTFCRQHEKLVSPVRYEERVTSILATTLKRAIWCNFLLSIRINLSNYVLVSLLVQLIGCMIPYGGQCLQHCAFGRSRFRRRCLCRGRFGKRLCLDMRCLNGGGGYG